MTTDLHPLHYEPKTQILIKLERLQDRQFDYTIYALGVCAFITQFN